MTRAPQTFAEGDELHGTCRFSIYYEDTDFSGYVYHANYLKYFERGREELVGLEFLKTLFQRGYHYVVARVELAYHSPARHGDLIEVRTQMKLTTSPISIVEQYAYLVDREGKKPEVKLVTGKIKMAFVNQDGQAVSIPQDVVEYFIKLQSESKA